MCFPRTSRSAPVTGRHRRIDSLPGRHRHLDPHLGRRPVGQGWRQSLPTGRGWRPALTGLARRQSSVTAAWGRSLVTLARRYSLSSPDQPGRRGSVLAVALLLLGLAPAAITAGPADRPAAVDPAAALAAREEAAEIISRSLPRDDAPDPDRPTPQPQATEPSASPPPKPEPQPEPTSAPKPQPPPKPNPAPDPEPQPEPEPEPQPEPESKPAPTPQPPTPIAGLSQPQMNNAATIVRVGKELGLPKRAYVIALATALQESYLRVLANPTYPESYRHSHQGTGSDHDSVGIFQQRPASGWGSVRECMDPEHSTRSFYQALQRVPGWQNLPVTVAAQAVQVSAFPDHYAKHEPLAWQLVAALT